MTITVYTFEDAGGCEQGWTTQNPSEAREYARKWQLKMIANEYEFSDSELVEDYTGRAEPDDEDVADEATDPSGVSS